MKKFKKDQQNKDFQHVFLIFRDFEIWVKGSKVFDLRFGFLVKNCEDFTPGSMGVRTLITRGLLSGPRGHVQRYCGGAYRSVEEI